MSTQETKNLEPIEAEIVNADEFDAMEAEALAVEDFTTYTHTFQTPFTYEGKTWESMTFDFGKLTGKDYMRIEDEMSKRGKMLVAAEFSGDFLARMAVRACTEKLPLNVLAALPLMAYAKIMGRARTFLLRSGQ